MINDISFSGVRSKLNQVEDCALKAKSFVKKKAKMINHLLQKAKLLYLLKN